MEHRWGERFPVDIAVRLAPRPYTLSAARLTDLSVSGGWIRTSLDLRRLARVQVALVLPQRFTHATPIVNAFVVRRSREGIGVEWCEFAPRAVIEVLRAMQLHRRRPSRKSGSHGSVLMHGT